MIVDQATVEAVATKLKRPPHLFGHRKTDPYLADAVLRGHLGFRRASGYQPNTLTAGLIALGIPLRREGWQARMAELRGELQRLARRWYLRRDLQIDQGNTPWCVDATRCHWQLSQPVKQLTYPLGVLYDECKKIDPWPGQDGTAAQYMEQVLRAKGLIESAWWYGGPQDAHAAITWLIEKGGLFFGANWPESAFRTRIIDRNTYGTDGLIQVTSGDPYQYGHETFLIGRTKDFKGLGPAIEGVQSWGVDNYGVRGRFWILEKDFFDHWMNPDEGWGDLGGFVEVRAA